MQSTMISYTIDHNLTVVFLSLGLERGVAEISRSKLIVMVSSICGMRVAGRARRLSRR